MERKKEKRFQECNKIEKIWRYRWYLALPFMFLYHKIMSLKVYEDKLDENDKWYQSDEYITAPSKLIWRLCIGMVQSKMKWYYTMEEVKERLDKKFNR